MEKKNKYINHPDYDSCVDCEHENIRAEDKLCCECISKDSPYRLWKPQTNYELDRILGINQK